MSWIWVPITLAVGLVMMQLVWRASPSRRKVEYRRGVSWFLGWSELTASTSVPSHGKYEHTAPVAIRSIRFWSAIGVILLVATPYFVSFAVIGSPDSIWARVVSFFPVTAPLAMPNRIAMGMAAWWEPVVAAALTLAAIAGLVQFGGRVYSRAILRTGPLLKLRDAWRGTTTPYRSRMGLVTPIRHLPQKDR